MYVFYNSYIDQTQIVKKELVKEAREVVKPTSGLHATSKTQRSQRIEWVDIGASTVSRVAEIYKDHQEKHS